MFGWHVPAPDQAMLVSGGKSRGDGGLPFRIVTGHGAFVVPVFRRVSYLTLSLMESVIEESCVTQQGIGLAVKSVIAFKVGSDHASIAAAAQRFLDDQDRMSVLTGQIFAGHLRSIVGSMTVEDIIRERQKLAEQVLEASKLEMANLGLAVDSLQIFAGHLRSIVGSMTVEDIIRERQKLAEQVLEASKLEMANLGLTVDSLQIQSIDDKGSGYINSLAAPHQAAVQQAAKVAQAQADQLAAEAQQASVQKQAEYSRATAVKQAEYQSEIDRAQATAKQAGPLAEAQAQQAVLEEQAKVAAKNAELREAELVAEVVKPAQAEAERIRTLAQADADRTKMSAEASAAEGRIALDQAIIAQLPEMMKAAAAGLANANLTILNGADGLNDAVAQLAAQGSTILQTLTGGLASSNGQEPEHAERSERSERPALNAGSDGAAGE